MSRSKNSLVQRIFVLVFTIIFTVLLSVGAMAADPVFSPDPPSKFNLTQDVNFYYDLNATDPDNNTPFVFSDDAASRGWDIFWMSNVTGEINFTPGNDDVGSNLVTLIVTDSNSDQDTKLVNFNVTNVNDPPNITGYSPVDLSPIIYENDSIGFTFNYNATDPDLPYGDTLTNIWIMDGVNQTANTSWVYRPGFCEPTGRNITLVVIDSEGLSDSVEWNVTVVNVNRPSQFNWSNPIQNLTWPEDSDLINNISLDNHFYDLDYLECGDQIDYSVDGNQSIVVNISSTPPHYVSFYTLQDWYGVEIVNFTTYDGYNYSTSNNVILNVTEIQDPPVLQNISNQDAYAFAAFVYLVNATDPDHDSLTYYDNTSLFDINPSSGKISFTPNSSVIGNYSIMINVSDGSTNVFTVFNLSIHNNSIPSISPVADQLIEESSVFQILINGSDLDGDSMNFSTNYTSLRDPVWNNGTSALFSFTPSQADVGTQRIRVTVSDVKGASNYTDFSLTITDINNAPVLQTIASPQIVKINRSFSMQLNATDSDNDNLNFTHNASATAFPNFLMNLTGFINFTANASDLGNHSVNITVWDITAIPKHDSQTVFFIVTYNRPPIIIPPGMQFAEEDEEFYLQIVAVDPDNDTVVFYSNSTVINLTSSGVINFTPNGSQVGLHSIYINATDGDGG